jgi:hypothetical protein
MAASKTLTGKGGSVTLNDVSIPVTKWTCKFSQELADSTDSSTYNSTTGKLWKKQDEGDTAAEGTIEGHFDLNTTQADVIALLATSSGPYPLTLVLNPTTNLITESLVSLSDADVTLQVPGATEVDFTANWKSYGEPVIGNG